MTGLSPLAIRQYVGEQMDKHMPLSYSPRVWRAVRKDAIEAAAKRFGVDPETIRRHLRFDGAK